MLKIQLPMIVSQASSEQRTFTDRTTGQSRQYLSSTLSGITEDFSTPLSLRVPDNLAPVLNTLKQGDHVLVSLSHFDSRRGGIAEGTVSGIDYGKV